MAKNNNMSPIFIHSLFRSGSTYLFNIFRRSEAGYRCYQEALHEQVYLNKENPELLLDTHEDAIEKYRHPVLNGAYWKELVEVWPVWKDALNEEVVYEEYFSADKNEAGCEYWKSLLGVNKERVVFQECRTSGRISVIKECLPGYQIYLWRNPWDQWWSYKVAPYFDMANQVIARSELAPECLLALCSALAIPAAAPTLDLASKFAFYNERPLTSEQSYLLFYMLWCLALKEGMDHADSIINIDRLSESEEYRKSIRNTLNNAADIKGIDFSDCKVPQAIYNKRDAEFFTNLESSVHQILLQHGWSADELNAVQQLRAEYQSAIQKQKEHSKEVIGLTEQSSRARELARRYETDLAERSRYIHQEQARTEKAETALRESTSQLEQVQAKLDESLSNAHNLWQRATAAENNNALLEKRINELLQSISWRITASLRSLKRIIILIVGSPIKAIKKYAIKVIQHGWLYVSKRPSLRQKLVRRLRSYPRLFVFIQNLAVKSGLILQSDLNVVSDIFNTSRVDNKAEERSSNFGFCITLRNDGVNVSQRTPLERALNKSRNSQ